MIKRSNSVQEFQGNIFFFLNKMSVLWYQISWKWKCFGKATLWKLSLGNSKWRTLVCKVI